MQIDPYLREKNSNIEGFFPEERKLLSNILIFSSFLSAIFSFILTFLTFFFYSYSNDIAGVWLFFAIISNKNLIFINKKIKNYLINKLFSYLLHQSPVFFLL